MTATNYDLTLFNDAGQTVLSNAVQILPVPVPVVTAVLPNPVKLGPFETNEWYPMLVTGDLINLPMLARNLTDAAHPVSAYLTGQFPPATMAALTKYLADKANSVPLETNLVRSLNTLIGGPLIYAPKLFPQVKLRLVTARLLGLNPQGTALVLLNRLLLEDAYPEEISRNGDKPPGLAGSPIFAVEDIKNLPSLAGNSRSPRLDCQLP